MFQNEEFNDINENHVGIDENSLTSTIATDAGYWPDNKGSSSSSTNGNSSDDMKSFKSLELKNGENYQVWIDYADSWMNVTMAPVGMKRPSRPLLNVSINLSSIFVRRCMLGLQQQQEDLLRVTKFLLGALVIRIFH